MTNYRIGPYRTTSDRIVPHRTTWQREQNIQILIIAGVIS